MASELHVESLDTQALYDLYGVPTHGEIALQHGWHVMKLKGDYPRFYQDSNEYGRVRRGFEWGRIEPHWNSLAEENALIFTVMGKLLIEANPDMANRMACRL